MVIKMMLHTFEKILDIVERHSNQEIKKFNRFPDLLVTIETNVSDENKEKILYDLDYELRDLISFSHTYENSKLQIIFN